jgi:hypothetical protein
MLVEAGFELLDEILDLVELPHADTASARSASDSEIRRKYDIDPPEGGCLSLSYSC